MIASIVLIKFTQFSFDRELQKRARSFSRAVERDAEEDKTPCR